MSNYCLPSDLYARYDCRILADLVQDDNVRLGDDTSVPLMQAALDTNLNLLDILEDASGVINSAVLVGQRYAVSDLTGLTGVDQAFLIRLACSLAFGMLVLRRGGVTDAELPPEYKDAREVLERLKNGEQVFNVLSDEQAGVPSAYFPTVTNYNALNLLRDYSTPRLFPTRRTQST